MVTHNSIKSKEGERAVRNVMHKIGACSMLKSSSMARVYACNCIHYAVTTSYVHVYKRYASCSEHMYERTHAHSGLVRKLTLITAHTNNALRHATDVNTCTCGATNNSTMHIGA